MWLKVFGLVFFLMMAGFACDDEEPDGDADGDNDGDSDTDGDSDGDSDGDGDGDSDVDADADSEGDAEVETGPLRVVLLIDASASMMCTDPELERQGVVENVLATLSDHPDVKVAPVFFHADVIAGDFGPPEASRFDQWDQAGPGTSIEDALRAALSHASEEIGQLDASALSSSRFEIVLIGDGQADPVCDPGCEDDDILCSDDLDNDGDDLIDSSDTDCSDTAPDRLYPICNAQWEEGTCPGLNRAEDIGAVIAELRALETTHGLASIRVSTSLVWFGDPAERCTTTFYPEGMHDDLVTYLQDIATQGGGTFWDLGEGEDIDIL